MFLYAIQNVTSKKNIIHLHSMKYKDTLMIYTSLRNIGSSIMLYWLFHISTRCSHSCICVFVICRIKSHGAYHGAYYAPRVVAYRGYYGHGYGSKYTRQLIDFHPVPWPKIIWNKWGDQYHNLFFYVSSSCKCTVNKIKPYFSYP